jgi:hypothetical protein
MMKLTIREREWWGGKIRSVAVNSGSIINIDLTIVINVNYAARINSY